LKSPEGKLQKASTKEFPKDFPEIICRHIIFRQFQFPAVGTFPVPFREGGISVFCRCRSWEIA
jgi:hypothetical protein